MQDRPEVTHSLFVFLFLFFFLINILLFLAKYKHFTAFYTYTNLSDDLQILSTVSYLET